VLLDPVGQVAHKLITEEVERDAVGVAARQLATKELDVEGLGFVKISGRDRKMEGVVTGSHVVVSAQNGFNWIPRTGSRRSSQE
jgi:hypothetical protein